MCILRFQGLNSEASLQHTTFTPTKNKSAGDKLGKLKVGIESVNLRNKSMVFITGKEANKIKTVESSGRSSSPCIYSSGRLND